MAEPTKSDYGDTLEAELIADMVAGGELLTDTCAALGVNIRTTYHRINNNPKFMQMMEEARETGYDVRAARIVGVVRGTDGISSGDVKRDRLIADVELKLLAKWHPKRYGEKLQVETKAANVTIPVGDDPVAARAAYEQLLKGH